MSEARPPSLPNRFCRPGVLSPEFLNITRRRTPLVSAFDSHDDRTETLQSQADDLPGRTVPSEPAIAKFKRVANAVRRQLRWFRLWAQDVEDCCKGINSDSGPPGLNVAAFRPASEQLSRKAKLILMKPVTVNLVRQKFWSRTKIFRKYWSARTKISWKKLSESGINGP